VIKEANPIVYKDSNGILFTALHRAARYGQIDIVKFVASRLENINPYDSSGLTPMHYAAKKNHTGFIEYYLESIHITDKNPGQISNDLFEVEQNKFDYPERGYLEIVKLILLHLKQVIGNLARILVSYMDRFQIIFNKTSMIFFSCIMHRSKSRAIIWVNVF
jgi:hypothetical protein